MEEAKIKFAKEVMRIVQDLGDIVYDAESREDLIKILGLTQEQMQIVIRRIVNSLPDKIFEETSKDKIEEIKNICAREFIFFQAQEKWDDPNYKDNLKTFLHSFARDIKQQFA